MAPVHILPA